jgi:hypothetical protein
MVVETDLRPPSSRRAPKRNEPQNPMQAGYAVVENFFAEAEEARDAVDHHFSEPHAHTPTSHQIWNYWFVPGLYAYLRTMPEKVMAPELAQRLFDRLRHHAFETYGLGRAHWPYLSLYVTGCYQGLHNDAKNGRLGYVYSLTRWDERKFGGGETLLLKDGPWSESSTVARGKGGASFYHLIPQNFNQLLVFDDRIPHAVQRIEGTMDPVAGRIAIHGHFAEAGVTVEGGLGGEQMNPALAKILAEFKRRQEKAAARYHGIVVLRVIVEPSGDHGAASILLDRVLPLRRDVPPFRSSGFADLLTDCRFPPAPQASRITIPVVIGDPITR